MDLPQLYQPWRGLPILLEKPMVVFSGKEVVDTVYLRNDTRESYTFKMRTTTVDRYKVSPCMGLLPEGGRASVSIRYLRAGMEERSQISDRFELFVRELSSDEQRAVSLYGAGDVRGSCAVLGVDPAEARSATKLFKHIWHRSGDPAATPPHCVALPAVFAMLRSDALPFNSTTVTAASPPSDASQQQQLLLAATHSQPAGGPDARSMPDDLPEAAGDDLLLLGARGAPSRRSTVSHGPEEEWATPGGGLIPLPVGAPVVVESLADQVHLNGQVGTVVGYQVGAVNAAPGSAKEQLLQVEFEDRHVPPVALRSQNLVLRVEGRGGAGQAGGVSGAPSVASSRDATAERLARMFAVIDTNGDGFITRAELIRALRSSREVQQLIGVDVDQNGFAAFEQFFQAADTDNDRKISWSEFEARCLERSRQLGLFNPARSPLSEAASAPSRGSAPPQPRSHAGEGHAAPRVGACPVAYTPQTTPQATPQGHPHSAQQVALPAPLQQGVGGRRSTPPEVQQVQGQTTPMLEQRREVAQRWETVPHVPTSTPLQPQEGQPARQALRHTPQPEPAVATPQQHPLAIQAGLPTPPPSHSQPDMQQQVPVTRQALRHTPQPEPDTPHALQIQGRAPTPPPSQPSEPPHPRYSQMQLQAQHHTPPAPSSSDPPPLLLPQPASHTTAPRSVASQPMHTMEVAGARAARQQQLLPPADAAPSSPIAPASLPQGTAAPLSAAAQQTHPAAAPSAATRGTARDETKRRSARFSETDFVISNADSFDRRRSTALPAAPHSRGMLPDEACPASMPQVGPHTSEATLHPAPPVVCDTGDFDPELPVSVPQSMPSQHPLNVSLANAHQAQLRTPEVSTVHSTQGGRGCAVGEAQALPSGGGGGPAPPALAAERGVQVAAPPMRHPLPLPDPNFPMPEAKDPVFEAPLMPLPLQEVLPLSPSLPAQQGVSSGGAGVQQQQQVQAQRPSTPAFPTEYKCVSPTRTELPPWYKQQQLQPQQITLHLPGFQQGPVGSEGGSVRSSAGGAVAQLSDSAVASRVSSSVDLPGAGRAGRRERGREAGGGAAGERRRLRSQSPAFKSLEAMVRGALEQESRIEMLVNDVVALAPQLAASPRAANMGMAS